MSPVWGTAGRTLLELSLSEARPFRGTEAVQDDCVSHRMCNELYLSSELVGEYASQLFCFQQTEASETLDLAQSRSTERASGAYLAKKCILLRNLWVKVAPAVQFPLAQRRGNSRAPPAPRDFASAGEWATIQSKHGSRSILLCKGHIKDGTRYR